MTGVTLTTEDAATPTATDDSASPTITDDSSLPVITDDSSPTATDDSAGATLTPIAKRAAHPDKGKDDPTSGSSSSRSRDDDSPSKTSDDNGKPTASTSSVEDNTSRTSDDNSRPTASPSGDDNGYAVKSDGTVWSWGDNTYGNLGNGVMCDRTVPATCQSNVPVQVVGIPIADEYLPYLEEVVGELKRSGVRAEIDYSSDRMQKKIRNATLQKVPFQLIVGEKDRDAGAVSFRFRDGTQENGIPVADAVVRIREAIATKAQV